MIHLLIKMLKITVKCIAAIFALFGAKETFAQGISYVVNNVMRSGEFRNNVTLKVVGRVSDSTKVEFIAPEFVLSGIDTAGGNPTGAMLWKMPNGRLKSTPMREIVVPMTTVLGLPDTLDTKMRTAAFAAMFTAALTAGSIATALGGTPVTTEIDPVFTASVASGITGTNISNWNTAYGWGNHATAGYLLSSTAASTYQPAGTYLTPSSTNTLTNKSGNISQWTNDVGYLTSISSGQVTTALGYTPYNATNPNGYISSVPAQSFASLTGKPTTLLGYGISDAYPLSGNPSGFLTSVPAQTFASVTGKPTTLSGYGITDGTSTARTAISITTTGTSGAATYNNSTGVLNVPQYTAAAPSFNTAPSRLLSTTGSNNTFTISSTKNARAHYTINFAFALTLTTSNGYVQLDYSTDGGTTWITCGSVSNVFSLAVTLTGNQDQELSGEIPANALCRLYRINATNVTVTAPTTKQLEITY